jgi:hypothetical protein
MILHDDDDNGSAERDAMAVCLGRNVCGSG